MEDPDIFVLLLCLYFCFFFSIGWVLLNDTIASQQST